MANIVAKKPIPPAIRAANFAQATRKHEQTLSAVPVVPGGSVPFEIPKARLLSGLSLIVRGTLTVTHASNTSYTPKLNAPFNLIKNIRLELNNGFAPFRTTGKGLCFYNKTLAHGDTLAVVTTANKRGRVLMETVASPGGTANDFRFELEMPVQINPRDAISLVNLQNPTTIVTVNIDFNPLSELLSDTTGYTITSNLVVEPTITSFTVPLIDDFIPDQSILKLVNEFEQAIPSAGEVTVKLTPGYTYRKVLLYFEDGSGNPMLDSDFTEFQIRLNQADSPVRISANNLAIQNHKTYGYPLDAGLYVLDFASLIGQVNLTGSRDYYDAERLTEFWIQTNSGKSGKVYVITETLARVAG